MAKDLYEILGVAKNADKDAIRKAFKRLARRYHPDVNPGDKDSERKFKEINAAHAVLSDDEKRKLYDEFGEISLQQGFDAKRAREWREAGGRGGFPSGGGFPQGEEFDWTEAAGGGMGGMPNFEDLFSDLFSGGRSRRGGRAQAAAGEDIGAEAEIDFLTSIKGGTVRLGLEKPVSCSVCGGTGTRDKKKVTCPDCGGSGRAPLARGPIRFERACPTCGGEGKLPGTPCSSCNGQGKVLGHETIDVKIPPGVKDGQKLRLAGLGAPGERGGSAGDLYVTIRTRPHDVFRREGDDLHVDVPLTVGEAIGGATISFPTPMGEVTLKIPPGTQTGRKFRLRGLGAASPRGKGDLYARAVVQVPSKNGGEVLDLAKRLDRFYDQNVRSGIRL